MFCLCSAYLSISQQNIKYVWRFYLHCQACCWGCPSQYQGWCVRVCRWMSAVRRCLPCVHPGMDFTRRMWSLWTLACFLSCVHQTPGHVVTLTVVASTHHSCNGAAQQERRPPCACVHRCEVDVWAGWGCLANWRMVSVSPCLTPPLGRVNSVLMKICRGALYFHFGSLQRSNW